MKKSFKYTFLVFLILFLSFFNSFSLKASLSKNNPIRLISGAEQLEQYLPFLGNKKVGILANHSSQINGKHLVDVLLEKKVNLQCIFAPEHGFRGKEEAGKIINDKVDLKTGLPIFSLYGKNKKPTSNQLEGIEVMLFDLQDVGVRFYTYISTLTYIMEACLEKNIPLIILDRPNPNGHYIDGPVLEPAWKSFVGMHPVPVVYGMTIGEYARMVKGEKWLESQKDASFLNLRIIPLKNYNRKLIYPLPVKPSPNLPNIKAINLYPSLCFFEGTAVSLGRGTTFPFQVYGSPYLNSKKYFFSFIPRPNEGSNNPPFNEKTCYGEDLRIIPYLSKINLTWLINAYKNFSNPLEFFDPLGKGNSHGDFFKKLSGGDHLKTQIEKGWNENQIRASWQEGINKFKKTRKKYLIY